MTSQIPPTETPKAGRREWIGLAIEALASLRYVWDLSYNQLPVH
jgi:hypothetical protein